MRGTARSGLRLVRRREPPHKSLRAAETLDRAAEPRFAAPAAYTPKHLAEKILTSKAVLEGERQHVTVLFAGLKDSMELLAGHNAEETRSSSIPC